jgi:hypothetical protein
MPRDYETLDVRPYQLMCLICRLGSDGSCRYPFEERLDEILAAARRDPLTPVRLRCNSDTDFAYQNPGHEYDTPEGALFNERRDLEVLRLLGLAPGDARPAEEMLDRVFRFIPTCRGVCGYDTVTSDAWRGCPIAASGNYERGVAMCLAALLPPRSEEEKARAKRESAAAVLSAKRLRIRPHHLLCLACFHAGRDRPEPIQEDNLAEIIEVCRRDPETPIEMIAGPCDVCPPCRSYRPDSNQCVKGQGAGLRDELRDLVALQALGLRYGDVMPARRLFRLLFERMDSTRTVCAWGDGQCRAPEWRVCGGEAGAPGYAAARRVGLGIPGVRVPEQTGQA